MTTRTNHHSNNTNAADVPSAPPETHQRAAFPAKAQHEISRVVLDAAMIELRPFVSEAQFEVLVQGCRGEEEVYFREVFLRLATLTRSMPKAWDQEGLGEHGVVFLHYFLGNNDWFHAYPVGCQDEILTLNLANGSTWLSDDTPRIPEGISR